MLNKDAALLTGHLEIGSWDLFGVWDLVLGISSETSHG
jgi:hypothetical protein